MTRRRFDGGNTDAPFTPILRFQADGELALNEAGVGLLCGVSADRVHAVVGDEPGPHNPSSLPPRWQATARRRLAEASAHAGTEEFFTQLMWLAERDGWQPIAVEDDNGYGVDLIEPEDR
ncbi:hypothetical protein [Williamsia sterculiae]|uniref:Uncharacterized protein n=1 Tax=Williamsia sterculiae TaxID=1344003 RepID=A0A1N7FEE0_9NOCA|nr:hypothetical protein [Williamsia sterculiae]SIR98586.1 hypothetical protein SAMN05445060_1978 [Williamsia sterculiae]